MLDLAGGIYLFYYFLPNALYFSFSGLISILKPFFFTSGFSYFLTSVLGIFGDIPYFSLFGISFLISFLTGISSLIR